MRATSEVAVIRFTGAPRWLLHYRYLGPHEAYAVESAKFVETLSDRGRTWYSPDRYTTRRDARAYLSLPHLPTHRLGPFPEDELPPFTVPLRRVEPAFGQPGGGWEAATDEPHYMPTSAPLG
jgi:hypothetical protein